MKFGTPFKNGLFQVLLERLLPLLLLPFDREDRERSLESESELQDDCERLLLLLLLLLLLHTTVPSTSEAKMLHAKCYLLIIILASTSLSL